MSHTLFVAVDARAVEADLWDTLNSNPTMALLMDVENENAMAFGSDIIGQTHLTKAIICAHVYRRIEGFDWLNVSEPDLVRDNTGAEVEFETKADAMLWKLSQQ